MAVRYKTKGFVFKKNDRLEADRLFSVFTEDFGKVEVLGRAIRKIASKLRGGIEIFSLSEIEFIQGKNYKTLTDAILIKRFGSIADNLEKKEVADKITDVLNNLINGQERDEQIWSLLTEIFEKLDKCEASFRRSQIIYYYFFWNFLKISGYSPEIYKCAVCRGKFNQKELYFSNKEGGIICGSCLAFHNDTQKINEDAVKLLRLILKKDWEILSKLKIDELSYNFFERISDNYYYYILSCHSLGFARGGILKTESKYGLKKILA